MLPQQPPETPQPFSHGIDRPHTQESDAPDGPPVQAPFKDAVSEPHSGNVTPKVDLVDEGTDTKLVAGDGDEKTQAVEDSHKDSLQELKDRVNSLEKRLWQAGLLEKPGDQSLPTTAPEELTASSVSKVEEKSAELPNLTNGADSSSSRHERGNGNEVDQVKGPLKAMKGPEESVQILMDRIDSFERRMQQSGHLKDEPAADEEDKPRLPAVPQLHYVEWSDFKNKLAGEERHYAIEVLIGGAKYFHQRSEEERKNKQRVKDLSIDRDRPITDHKSSALLPERIRINSRPVLLIMNQIDPTDRSEYPMVMLRPFKPLIYHEARIREIFQNLVKKWGSTDMEAPISHAVEPAATEDVGDSKTPAVSDGAIGSISAESQVQSEVKNAPNTITDSVNIKIAPNNETVTGSDKIHPLSTAENPQSSLPTVTGSPEQSATTEVETITPKAGPKMESKDTRNQETEDLTESLEALRDFRCLIEFIDVELKPLADSYRDMTRQTVSFCDLWYLFKPGDLLYSPLGNKQASDFIRAGGYTYPQKPNDRFQEVWRIACTTGGRPHLEEANENYSHSSHKSNVNAFLISVYWVDFNATRFVPRTFILNILPFPGERDIISLQCYPLRYALKADQMKSRWKARGEAFREYMTFKYRYYIGKTLTCTPDGYGGPEGVYPKHAQQIDSQVVIDFGEALAAHPGWRTSGSELQFAPDDAAGELSENYPTCYWKDIHRKVLDEEIDDKIYEDEHIDTKLLKEFVESDPLLRDHEQTSPAGDIALEEDHLVLLPNRVFAFVMKIRRWAIVTVDGLRPVKRYDGGFKDLQLPTGHKHTIRSLVNNHFNNRDADLDELEASHDADLVRGKGKGLVILLHGAPGVGKTSTAETAADAFGKILLPITCGDLGLTAADVESELSEKFHLAELWGCVLLLDEADVFLARRNNTDLKRNSLVSVFLRVLEHFTGVLFLTTNRVGAFDEAFKSRIHMTLYYPPLDAEKTWSIWKMNLERLSQKKQRRNESMQIDEKEIFAYAQSHYTETSSRGANWNGRQIRNAFQTASALAEFETHERNKRVKARSTETGEGFVPDSPQLKVKHFREVAWASYEFDKYIYETKGSTEAEIAWMEGQRTDAYQSRKRLVRDREHHPIRTREAGPRSMVQGQASLADRTSDSRSRQINARPPIASTYGAIEAQDPRYEQPKTKSISGYGARNIAAIPQGERSRVASSRPKSVQQPSPFVIHDRERQRQVAFDEPEPQYIYEDQEETEYEQTYEAPLTQPTSTHTYFEDVDPPQLSPRRRPVADVLVTSRKPAVRTYVEDYENDEDAFDA